MDRHNRPLFPLLSLVFAVLAVVPAAATQSTNVGSEAANGNGTDDAFGSWYVAERVSVSSTGTGGNNLSVIASASGDGRFVTFLSDASDLVAGDTNDVRDVFVHDRMLGSTERISVSSIGIQANARSFGASINADGRYVAFWSEASNLVPGDTNWIADVFVHDRESGVTERVSTSSAGVQGDGLSYYPSMSADGRYIAFSSEASNLVTGDTNGAADVFVHDRESGVTERVSVSSAGVQGDGSSPYPSISADGRSVAFPSYASNLVTGDTNGAADVFVHDRESGVTERVSVSSTGVEGNSWSYWPSISADGRYVAFSAYASNLVPNDTNWVEDVFVRDGESGVTERVSVSSAGVQGDATSHSPSISADGRYVAFDSEATNLATADTNAETDVFVHDRQSGVTHRVLSYRGTEGDHMSERPSISGDGRHVAFTSLATNLTEGDTNWSFDVFVAENAAFADVMSSVFEADIEWLAGEAITKGCNPPFNSLFCPDDHVTRGQMAAFLVRALDLTDEGGGNVFTDDNGSIFESSIDILSTAGITRGCNPPVNDMFCPNSFVTRGQMAAFLVRALGLSDDGGGDLFEDDDGSIFESAIDKLATAGVTRGCNPPINDQFCPHSYVTRGQMAAFLHRALGD